MTALFSTPDQLARVGHILSRYLRLPVSTAAVPGAFLESVLAHVRGGTVLATKDYVDVVVPADRVGWSIKSTMAGSPLTWMRATFADRDERVRDARTSDAGTQALGAAIIGLCNEHARASLERYDLEAIGYARLIVRATDILYFERQLCSRAAPAIFDPADFAWSWSTREVDAGEVIVKALHGKDAAGRKCWSWYPGQNQLHFNGDPLWRPAPGSPHAATFRAPTARDKLSFDWLIDRLDAA